MNAKRMYIICLIRMFYVHGAYSGYLSLWTTKMCKVESFREPDAYIPMRMKVEVKYHWD